MKSINMTKLIITFATMAGIAMLAACSTDRDPSPATQTSSTTTESSTIQPVPATTETQTVRSY
jgi:ABC-type glycerol-3-phosphate transport system substrate-binding protein